MWERDCSGAAAEVHPECVQFFMPGDGPTQLLSPESENAYVDTTDQLRSYSSST